MNVGVVGVGEMGAAIAGHLVAKGHRVTAYDVDAAKLKAVAARGIAMASGLEDIAKKGEIFLAIVSTDEQSAQVTDVLSQHANVGALIVVRAGRRTGRPAAATRRTRRTCRRLRPLRLRQIDFDPLHQPA